MALRPDLQLLMQWIEPGSRILDLGCGNGTLMKTLQKERRTHALGIEIDQDRLVCCMRDGLQVIQQDLNQGLKNISDQSFETVIMTYALHEVDNPLSMLKEMLRVGHQVIVSFPNLGHWHNRLRLLLFGRVPQLPGNSGQWYQSTNIHQSTLSDFETLCRDNGFAIKKRVCIGSNKIANRIAGLWPNLLAAAAVYLISKK